MVAIASMASLEVDQLLNEASSEDGEDSHQSASLEDILATDDGSTPVTTSSEAWITLSVSVDGDDVSVWWDGTEVVSTTLTGAGPIGLDRVGLYTYDNDGGLYYDNLVITNP